MVYKRPVSIHRPKIFLGAMEKMVVKKLQDLNLSHVLMICIALLPSCISTGRTFAAGMNSTHAKELAAEAYKTGVVRIIVTLALDTSRDDGGQAIKKAREELLKELSPFRVKKLKQYRSLPVLVLEVGPAALCYLLASPSVSSVEPDALAHTMGIFSPGRIQAED